MSSTNVNDAKKECTANPKCHMFIDYLGDGRSFGACENTALIKDSTIIGSALYQKSYGNKISTFEYLSDKLKMLMKYISITKLFFITVECNSNEDCTGASDTCKDNLCYCGPREGKCSKLCTDGKCLGK